MGKWRKKPVEVEANLWFADGDHEAVKEYSVPLTTLGGACKHCNNYLAYHGWIATLEGGHIVCPGDWIITGVEGEHYPCKPKIFEKTYEKVEGENE